MYSTVSLEESSVRSQTLRDVMDLIVQLFDAVVKGDEYAVLHLLRIGGNILVNDEYGYTVLHWAAASSEGEKLTPLLISKGANINATDNMGYTPLHIHCARGRNYGVGCLLHHGALLNLQTKANGTTALMIASNHHFVEVVKLLLAYGADVNIKSKDGKSAKEYGLLDYIISTSLKN